LPVAPSFAFLFVLMHANRYLLEWRAGIEAVGIYSIGFSLGATISLLTGGILTAWYPFFMSYMERREEAKALFGRIFTYYVLGVGGLCLLYFLAARPVVFLLTQPAFHAAADVVGLVALAHVLVGAFNFFLPNLYFHKDIKYISIVQGIAAAVALVGNHVLIGRFGLIGAAIGLVAGSLLMTLMMWGWNRLNATRYGNMPIEAGRMAGLFVLSFVIFLAYLAVPTGGLAAEFAKSTLFSLVAAAMLFGLLGAAERNFIVRTVRRFVAAAGGRSEA
jgi:O-antigen/teichoic acid export membrane protein